MTTPAPEELQRLLVEERSLRELARGLAADPDDVVQQTWLQALQHQGPPIEQPRPWLKRIALNVARNLQRSEGRRSDRERTAARIDAVPSSAELAVREERRQQIVAAIDQLPDSLRTVVLLRYFEGLPPRRIAAKLGVPVATVSTQLHRGLELLRRRLDSDHGPERAAWLLPLISFGAGPDACPPALPSLSSPLPAPAVTFWTGLIVMQTKSKLILGTMISLLALACGLGVWAATSSTDPDPISSPSPLQGGAVAETDRLAPPDGLSDLPEKREAVVAKRAPKPSTGSLTIRVHYADGQGPAADIGVRALSFGGENRRDAQRGRTDAAGSATLSTMPPGRFFVLADGRWQGAPVTIVAGKNTTIELQPKPGLHVKGVVVDGTGRPIPGAQVEVASLGRTTYVADVTTVSGADGTFRMLGVQSPCQISARAPGFASSRRQFLRGLGSTELVRFVLDQPGGEVVGVVSGPGGEPIAGAKVLVGEGQATGLYVGTSEGPPLPAVVSTNARGEFRAVGVAAGRQPVLVSAYGLVPWQGECEVVVGNRARVHATLGKGCRLRGVVRDSSGGPVHRAHVHIGDAHAPEHFRAVTAKDGTFQLTGLPAGKHTVAGSHERFGRGEQVAVASLDGSEDCEVVLSQGLELRGRLRSMKGRAVRKGMIDVYGAKPGGGVFTGWACPDEDGRFVVPNCPEGSGLTVSIGGRSFRRILRHDVDPRQGPLDLRVETTVPSAHVLGRVVDGAGQPIQGVSIQALSREEFQGVGSPATGDDGRFKMGPLAPDHWSFKITGSGYPLTRLDARRLVANAKLDLGEIRLVRGGVAVVDLSGPKIDAVWLEIVDQQKRRTLSMSQDTASSRRSHPLAPGGHYLLVSGTGIAARVIPFMVRSGEETKVRVTLERGIEQRFEFHARRELTIDDTIEVRVRRGGKLVHIASAVEASHSRKPESIWLAPGRYEVTASFGDLRAAAVVTVGEKAGSTQRLDLR